MKRRAIRLEFSILFLGRFVIRSPRRPAQKIKTFAKELPANHGRRSTYRRGKSVQTTGATSVRQEFSCAVHPRNPTKALYSAHFNRYDQLVVHSPDASLPMKMKEVCPRVLSPDGGLYTLSAQERLRSNGWGGALSNTFKYPIAHSSPIAALSSMTLKALFS
jgi:hypothetical protein